MAGPNGQQGCPIYVEDAQNAPHLTVAHHHQAADGSEWLYAGDIYQQIVEPWAVEQHVGPIREHVKLGDVESWAEYVVRFAPADILEIESGVLLTWDRAGLRAVLDYHRNDQTPNRCQWTAAHPFERTRQWLAWERIANGNAISQKVLIEALEDHRDDIREPDAASLVAMLTTLRATVNASAEATLDGNGNTLIGFTRQTKTSLKLPSTITIGIPVLKGHTAIDERGVEGPVRYEIEVKLRVDVLDEGKVAFRLTWPESEAALEDAIADRVAEAKRLLGDAYSLLRAAGS